MLRLACPDEKWWVLVGGLLFLLHGPAGSALAAAPVPDSTKPEKYWILLADRPDADTTGPDAWTQPVAPAYRARLRELGIHPLVRSRWLHAVSARLSPPQRAQIRTKPFVQAVRPVGSTHVTGSPASARPLWPGRDPTSPPPGSLQLGPSRAHLALINAVAPMERGLDGHGVRVGFLDAHFRALRHSAFDELQRENRMVALRNFTAGRQSGNHGMGVASVTVGEAPGTLLGPARGAQILGATTEYTPFERNVEEDNFVAGLEWLYRRGADVVNVSIGYNTFDEGQDSYSTEDLDGDTGITTRAVDRATQLGMVVVVSAGNSGCASPDSCWYYVNTPADADSAITVGGVAPDSSLASFSSRGPTADGRIKPDVVVQAENVPAAWNNDGYAEVGGTSFASPQVTGIVAQMLQVNPDLGPIEVRALLRRTASQADNPDNRKGWGIVDAHAALRAAERRARTTPPSTLSVAAPYPNPASTQLTVPVHVPAATDSLTLILESPLGRRAHTKTVAVRPGPNWITMETRSLSPGLYIYRLRGTRRTKTGTVAVRR